MNKGLVMNRLMLLLATVLLSTTSTQAAFDVPDYRTAKGNVYQIHDNKAYKVIVVDGEYLTSNEWFPLDETGYTKEHVQMVKERQAKYANQFIKKNRGY
jgi:hypothetical protein